MSKPKKCYYCKFRSDTFKIAKLTHLHCEHPAKYSKEAYERGDFESPWDTLREWWDTCEDYEIK
jgi:hypothetical protein